MLGLPDVEEVSFATADGLTLRGWFLPARSSPRPVTVLVCSGNGGNRAYRASLGVALRARGFAVLLFDYRGYGGNPGSPSEGAWRPTHWPRVPTCSSAAMSTRLGSSTSASRWAPRWLSAWPWRTRLPR